MRFILVKDKEEKTVCNRSLTVELTIVENSLIYFKAGLDHIYSIFVRDPKSDRSYSWLGACGEPAVDTLWLGAEPH